MKRRFAVAAAAAVSLAALLGVLAPGSPVAGQDGPSPEERRLDDMIRSLTEALAAKQATAGGAPPLVFETRFYDVRDLVHPVVDRPLFREAGSLVPSGGFGFGDLTEESAEPLVAWEPDGLVELVRWNIAPSSWDELQSARVECTGEGMLVVRHVAVVHDRVAGLLASLRARSAAQVAVDCRVVAVPDGLLRTLLPEPGQFVLSTEAAAALEKAVADGTVREERAGGLLCTSTQRVGLADGSEVGYVQDYDVEIAKGVSIGDPIVLTFTDGLTLEVRPVVTGEDVALLDIRADCAVRRMPPATFETPLGAIDTPALDLVTVRTTLAVPTGAWAVAGGSLGGEGRLVLVRATVPGRGGK